MRDTLKTNGAAEALDALRVISEPQAAELIGVSTATFSRLRQRGEAPPLVKLSRHRVGYRLSDIRKWLDGRSAPSTLGTIIDAD